MTEYYKYGKPGIIYQDPLKNECLYKACPRCDACNVCQDFHGNFVGACTDDCPYRWYHRIRDWLRRNKIVFYILEAGEIAIWTTAILLEILLVVRMTRN